MSAPQHEAAPARGGSIWTRKYGPLPFWAYALILLGLVGAWRLYSQAKQAKSTQQDPQLIGGDQQPPIVFQDYDTTINVPPAGGRQWPPNHVPNDGPGHGHVPDPPPPPPDKKPPPVPPPPPPGPPPPAPPAGQWVTVAKWTAKNPPWNSTISGIAGHLGLGSNWGKVWNDPANASLRTRRKDPKLIQPGDRVFVPAK